MPNIFEAIATSQQYNPQIQIALLILERYNARASEVLQACWKDFYEGKLLVMHGTKHSANVIVRDSIILEKLSRLERSKSPLIFYAISYRKLYNIIKKNYSHLFAQYKTKKNFKVTHGFRYVNANLTNNATEVKNILHHNSKRSSKFYNKNIPDGS